jgi:hypothetical protein
MLELTRGNDGPMRAQLDDVDEAVRRVVHGLLPAGPAVAPAPQRVAEEAPSLTPRIDKAPGARGEK